VNRRAGAVASLEARLGHRFKDKALLERALTHVSVREVAADQLHNETLEFLGDRVLGLLVAEALVGRNPAWREGDLTRAHAALVNGSRCAQVARGLQMGAALRLHASASKEGARENDRILGDAMEAIMAAVYLDGGLEAAREVFRSAWNTALLEATREAAKDPKTALQEWAAARGIAPPLYRTVSRVGSAHSPVFTVEVTLRGLSPEHASAANLRMAEKAAAAALLEREAVR
jgi:ribonuclease-3